MPKPGGKTLDIDVALTLKANNLADSILYPFSLHFNHWVRLASLSHSPVLSLYTAFTTRTVQESFSYIYTVKFTFLTFRATRLNVQEEKSDRGITTVTQEDENGRDVIAVTQENVDGRHLITVIHDDEDSRGILTAIKKTLVLLSFELEIDHQSFD